MHLRSTNGGVRDGGLVAPTHTKRVDAFEIHKRGVRYGELVEPILFSI